MRTISAEYVALWTLATGIAIGLVAVLWAWIKVAAWVTQWL